MSTRDLEPGIVTDLRRPADLRRLSAARPAARRAAAAVRRSGGRSPRHDEMLFIIQHQVSELWMKLMIHELKAAIAHVRADALEPMLQDPGARQAHPEAAVRAMGGAGDADAVGVRRVPPDARQLVAGSSRAQYRAIEFLLGNKSAAMLDVFRHDPAACAELDALLRAPSLYDEFLRHLARRGLPVPRGMPRARLHAALRAPSRPRAGVQDDLRGSEAVVGRVRHVREAGRRRGELPALALPAHEDRRADHRPQDGHRRLVGRELTSSARSTRRSSRS